jgi:2-amino-4-hydroxy-6-hydroxymethyldihydropteridine diphosphokinase
MRSFSKVRKISTLRETKPIGVGDQPKFLNAIVELETDYSPKEMLAELHRIEEELGRIRGNKGAPREIDLDIVAYGDEVVEEEGLVIPHPRMHERRFVLEPLAELNPKWIHPQIKKNVKELLARLPSDES